MKQTIASFVAVYALIIGATSCNNANSISTPTIAAGTAQPTTTTTSASYVQIEKLARPAIKEALQSYDAHEATARANPYNDPNLTSSIAQFITQGPLKRSAAYSTALISVLVPDEMAFDLSKTSGAGYLQTELAGGFGGRQIADDVISADLGAVFGPGGGPFPTEPSTGVPCLTTDNVPSSPQAKLTSTFPYTQPAN